MNNSIKIPTKQQFLDFVLDWTKDPKVLPLIGHVCDLPGFLTLPATVNEKHHAYAGGLAVHTWEVLHLCRASAESSVRAARPVDKVVLSVAAMWHDSGKNWEYVQQEIEGRLVTRKSPAFIAGNSHIMFALMQWGYLVGACEPEDFPLTIAQCNKVTHCIAGHHGKLAWGSPVIPNSQEAVLLHHADVQSVMLGGGINPELRPQ
jgi:3'-5' exoribonuclease